MTIVYKDGRIAADRMETIGGIKRERLPRVVTVSEYDEIVVIAGIEHGESVGQGERDSFLETLAQAVNEGIGRENDGSGGVVEYLIGRINARRVPSGSCGIVVVFQLSEPILTEDGDDESGHWMRRHERTALLLTDAGLTYAHPDGDAVGIGAVAAVAALRGMDTSGPCDESGMAEVGLAIASTLVHGIGDKIDVIGGPEWAGGVGFAEVGGL